LDRDVQAVHADNLTSWLGRWDIRGEAPDPRAVELFHAAPGGQRTTQPFSSTVRWASLDTDRENGCVRSLDHAYSADGGLAVLFGNLAENGCVVKTAGVPEELWGFEGPALVTESQDEAVAAILGGRVAPGTVLVVRYEGPKGGPGMQEMLYPTSYLKALGLGRQCALVTDGRFSGGSSGLSIGHVSPEAADGGAIALVRDGDRIAISIPERSIRLLVDQAELADRRTERAATGFAPRDRTRPLSQALKVYASLAQSADKGAARRRLA
jgi:dihydroxy-acid dehydratase